VVSIPAVTTTRGFQGRRRSTDDRLPPGQYLVDDFPVLTAGPTPRIPLEQWALTVREGTNEHTWSWTEFGALPVDRFTTDLHCVTRWSKLDTEWEGVAVDTLAEAAGVGEAPYALITSYGGYTTNVPTEDLLGGRAWVAFRYDGSALEPEHGGPARLLVPHLYLWKSAKWVGEIEFLEEDEPGFWEVAGYHNYGDPWREQRYQGD
jgi:DMSO/TMAO reductase YedYZ molybdopterin-dependent catalytic subunit